MKASQTLFILFVYLILLGCSTTEKGSQQTPVDISFNTNNWYFEQHELTIKGVYLIDQAGTSLPLLDEPHTLNFNNKRIAHKPILKEIAAGQYSGLIIKLDTQNATVIQEQLGPDKTLIKKTFTLESLEGINNELSVHISTPILIEENTINHLEIFYDASQSIGLKTTDPNEDTLVFSPMFSVNKLNTTKDKQQTIEASNEPEELSRIKAIDGDVISIEHEGVVKRLNIEDIDLVANSQKAITFTKSHLHIGQYVIYHASKSELELLPSFITAEIPKLPKGVSHYNFEITTLNSLPAHELLGNGWLEIDFTLLEDLKFLDLTHAYIAFEGFLDIAQQRFHPVEYSLIPLDNVNVVINFPAGEKQFGFEASSNGQYQLIMAGESLAKANAIMSINDINTPVDTHIRSIVFTQSSINRLKYNNQEIINLQTFKTSNLLAQLNDWFNKGYSVSSLYLTGRFDYKTQTLTTKSSSITLQLSATDSGDKVIPVNITADEIKNSVIIASSVLVGGMLTVSLVAIVFTNKADGTRKKLNSLLDKVDMDKINGFIDTAKETTKKAGDAITNLEKVGFFQWARKGHKKPK